MEQADGPGTGGQGTWQFPFRARLGHGGAELFEQPPHQRAQPALRQPFRQGINRRDAVEMDGCFQRLDDFGFRVVDRAGAEGTRLAENDHLVARFEIISHEGQVPPAAMQPAGAVVQDQFKKRAAAAHAPRPGRDGRAASQGGRAQLQIGDALEMAAVLVAERAVQEQVAHGAQVQPLQLRGPFRAHAGHLGQRQLQWIWRHRHNDVIVDGPHNTKNFALSANWQSLYIPVHWVRASFLPNIRDAQTLQSSP